MPVQQNANKSINVANAEGPELTQIIRDALQEFLYVNDMSKKFEETDKVVKEYQKIKEAHLKDSLKTPVRLFLGWSFVIVLWAVLMFICIIFIAAGPFACINRNNSADEIIDTLGNPVYWIVPAIIAIVLAVIITVALIAANKKKLYLLPVEEQKLKNIQNEFIERAKTFYALESIPKKFAEPLALETMLEYLENGEATKWEQVAKLYREQESRWIVERNSEIAAEYAQKAAQSAESARRWAIWSNMK